MAESSEKKDQAGAEEEPKHSRERLIAEAHDFVGHDPHVVAGALHDMKGNEFTLTEVKAAVKNWLKRPVETDQQEA